MLAPQSPSPPPQNPCFLVLFVLFGALVISSVSASPTPLNFCAFWCFSCFFVLYTFLCVGLPHSPTFRCFLVLFVLFGALYISFAFTSSPPPLATISVLFRAFWAFWWSLHFPLFTSFPSPTISVRFGAFCVFWCSLLFLHQKAAQNTSTVPGHLLTTRIWKNMQCKARL